MNFELSFISNKKNCLKENVFHAKKERKRADDDDDDDDAMLSNSAINEVTHIMYFLQFFFWRKKLSFAIY